MYREQIEMIRSIKTSELSSRDGFLGKPIGCYLSYQRHSSLYMLNVRELSNRFPVFSGFQSHELAEQFITKELIAYSRANIFKKIWWRLTKPIDFYLHVYNVLTLTKLSKSLEDNRLSEATNIYKHSALPKLVTFMDRLSNSWSSYLELFFANEPEEDFTSSPQMISQSLGKQSNTYTSNFTYNDKDLYDKSLNNAATYQRTVCTDLQQRANIINKGLESLGSQQRLTPLFGDNSGCRFGNR